MATIVLQAAGAFLGGALGPVGSAIGSAAGAIAGYMVDRAVINSTKRYEGPRLSAARPLTAEDGTPLPRVYGTVRVGGTLIWATRFEERSTSTRQGGKGGPKVTTYSYFANAAFALCEGEIAGVRRIWADGVEIDRDKVEVRVYRGSHDQPVDPLIEAKQGSGNAPAYRGTAYVVIDHLPIEDYGRRIPQFQFEVIRVAGELNDRVRSVALIPGSTEYGLYPTLVKHDDGRGKAEAINRHMHLAASDLEASLDELQMLCPNLETVSLIVAWFGDDLRAGECTIRPKVTQNSPSGFSQDWRVSGIERPVAELVSLADGKVAYGGTPTDASVMAAIAAIRQRGLKVALYPFIMMDIPETSGLPDPYGGVEQAAYPWRGRVTCHPAAGMAGTADKTAAARTQIVAFAGAATAADFAPSSDTVVFNGASNEWSYRRFLLHYAQLAAAAGGVDCFLIGSELRGLTTVRDGQDLFPFVEVLEALAAEVRTVLGGDTTITYAADWSEYFGYHPSDGTGDVFFHLDTLWAHPDIDAVGIDYYMPLSDWRDTDFDGSNPDSFSGPYDLEALAGGLVSGEGYDWYYASEADRAARVRLPISDGAYGKDWVFRTKDLAGWWSNQHFNRVGGIEAPAATAWVPQSKPIHFTELGCAAVDKSPNQPNAFPDPKSHENSVPHFSNGGRSDLAQYRLLLAHYHHWEDGGAQANPISSVYGGPMVDVGAISLWAWDARPFPAFPIYGDVWSDGANWSRGHWLNGRLCGISVSALINAILADHGLPAADTIRADGVVAGYLVSEPTTARAALEPVVTLFGLGVREQESGLVFATEGATAGPSLSVDDLVVDGEREIVERTRSPDNELPALAHLDFRDVLNDHQSATAAVNYAGAGGNGTAFMSFPGALATAEANGLVRDLLRRSWDGRERVQFSVPMNEQRLGPGSIVRLPQSGGPDYLVTEVEEGLARMIKARRVVRIAPAPALGADVPVRNANEEGFAVGQPHALFLDLPIRSAGDVAHEQLRIAAHVEPWRNQAVFVSPEATGFSPRSTLSRRAVIGALTESLAPAGTAGRADMASTVMVKLYGGELQSVSWVQLFNGANAAAVKSEAGGWEILQFATAEEVESDLWRLSGLLRGQLGTEDLMAAGAPADASFVLLDGAVEPAGLRPEEIGLELNWRVGPAGYDLSGENFAVSTMAGGMRALLPLSPVHLASHFEGGDLYLSWIRRSRLEADSWLAQEVPLGEQEEQYRIEIAPVDGNVVRSATAAQPAWTYTAAMAIDDFGVLPPAVDVTLRQVSTAIGPGQPLKRTVVFP